MKYRINKYSYNDKYLDYAIITTERNLTFKDMIDYIYTEFYEEVTFMGGYYNSRFNSMIYSYQGKSYRYVVYIEE